ncbi:hypothetical protein COO60DRAFT_1636865 [Scenedesmus sp. NREL 46B-D3]|nr:hypothetical protein COO60DRAFT_1636865 [Scenedesmus sp. NREL 46B-D3]
MSVLVDVPSALLGPALNLRLSPCMRQPNTAAGLAEFWGRRYNLVVSSTLRFSVFKLLMAVRCCRYKLDVPSSGAAGADRAACAGAKLQASTCSGRERCRRCRAAHAVAATAAFAVSALMHELCVW